MNKYVNKILFLGLIFSLLMSSFCFATVEDSPIAVDSPAAILMHIDTGNILYEKDAYTRMYPASTTKVMTAILVIESGHDLSEIATVSSTAISTIPNGYSTAYLQAGEQFTLEQLLNVLLLPSANDAANVLAEFISGSVQNFSDLMNEKALKLGCIGTHFVNPSGIHDENHYSTAYDLCYIAKYALQNETFRKFVRKTYCSLPATEQYPSSDRVFTNTNSLIIPSTQENPNIYYYPYAIGVKTGYTTPAQNCLIAACSHDGLEFITVVLGSTNEYEYDGSSVRYLDTIKLFDYALKNYSYKKLVSKGDLVTEAQIKNATYDTQNLTVISDRDVSVLINSHDNSNILPEITLKNNLLAPIHVNDIVGTMKYTVMGIEYEANLVAGQEVKTSTIYIKITAVMLVALIIALIIILINSKEK